MEVFAEERRHLLAVPRPFDGYAADEARVSRTSLVRYDRNWRLSNTMDAAFCVAALEEAMNRYGVPAVS